MTYDKVLSELKSKSYAPIYLLHGEESYFIDKITEYIESAVLDEAEKAFNQVILYGKEAEVSQVIDYVRQFPMMAPHRVIIVKEAQAMSKLDLLEKYAANPSPQNILVLCHKHKKLDGRSKLIKAIKAKGVVFESKKLYDNQVPGWITKSFSSRGKSISPQAAQMMAEFLGSDLSKIANEIEKILVNAKEVSTISEDIVKEQVGITKDYNVFELQKALSVYDTKKVFQIVDYFRANPKSNPLVLVLASLFNYFSKVYVVAYYKKSKPDNELAQLAGVSPFFVKEYKQAANHYKLGKLVHIFKNIKLADLRSKGIDSRGMKEGEILRTLMISILY